MAHQLVNSLSLHSQHENHHRLAFTRPMCLMPTPHHPSTSTDACTDGKAGGRNGGQYGCSTSCGVLVDGTRYTRAFRNGIDELLTPLRRQVRKKRHRRRRGADAATARDQAATPTQTAPARPKEKKIKVKSYHWH